MTVVKTRVLGGSVPLSNSSSSDVLKDGTGPGFDGDLVLHQYNLLISM